MIHIAFSEISSLKIALKEMKLDKKDKVITFGDIFSIGPVWNLQEKNGLEFRFEWLKKCIDDEFGEFLSYKQRFEKAIDQVNTIPEGSHLMIWCSDSAHEQTGLRYVIYLLKDRDVNITLINTTIAYEELFHTKNSKSILSHTGEIPAEKLQIIYEQEYGPFFPYFTEHDRDDLEWEWLDLSEST